jgi:molybdate transport system regulatory protein
MLQIDGSIWLRTTLGGQSRIDLLMHIEATGSITAAARAAGMSYKGAWDAINTMNNLAGEPLIVRSAGGKGGGTQLTERARQLIASFNALQREHQRFLKHLAKVDLTIAKDLNVLRRLMLRTSARNQLPGTVTAIETGAVNDEVTLCMAGDQTLVASLSHASAQEPCQRPGAGLGARQGSHCIDQSLIRHGRAAWRRHTLVRAQSIGGYRERRASGRHQ